MDLMDIPSKNGDNVHQNVGEETAQVSLSVPPGVQQVPDFKLPNPLNLRTSFWLNSEDLFCTRQKCVLPGVFLTDTPRLQNFRGKHRVKKQSFFLNDRFFNKSLREIWPDRYETWSCLFGNIVRSTDHFYFFAIIGYSCWLFGIPVTYYRRAAVLRVRVTSQASILQLSGEFLYLSEWGKISKWTLDLQEVPSDITGARMMLFNNGGDKIFKIIDFHTNNALFSRSSREYFVPNGRSFTPELTLSVWNRDDELLLEKLIPRFHFVVPLPDDGIVIARVNTFMIIVYNADLTERKRFTINDFFPEFPAGGISNVVFIKVEPPHGSSAREDDEESKSGRACKLHVVINKIVFEVDLGASATGSCISTV